MKSLVDIPHPRLLAPGTAQTERSRPALDTHNVKVDERSLSDLLHFIYAFAGRINYYDTELGVGHWQPIFDRNILFALAKWHHLDVPLLRSHFEQLLTRSSAQVSIEGVSQIFHFIEKELILPLHERQTMLHKLPLERAKELDRNIRSIAQPAVVRFAGLANGSQSWYGTGKFDLSQLQQDAAWNIDLSELYHLDLSFRNIPGNRSRRLASIRQSLKEIAMPLLELLEVVCSQAETLLLEIQHQPEGRRNAPHIGLLLAFLKLFHHLQGDINHLTKRHLEYFYTEVLSIKPRSASPDQAFVIFALQKHIKDHFLQKGTQLLDGKDRAKQNVLFGLEQGIVVDEAQITDVRSLHLHHVEGSPVPPTVVEDHKPTKEGLPAKNADDKSEFVQGLYIAPEARTRDGLEEALDTDQSWHTLGNRYSKAFPVQVPPTIQPTEYPHARVGFVLESPVLFLNEGTRKIKLTLRCSFKPLDCIATSFQELNTLEILDHLNTLFVKLTPQKIDEAASSGLPTKTKEWLETTMGIQDTPYLPITQIEQHILNQIEPHTINAGDPLTVSQVVTATIKEIRDVSPKISNSVLEQIRENVLSDIQADIVQVGNSITLVLRNSLKPGVKDEAIKEIRQVIVSHGSTWSIDQVKKAKVDRLTETMSDVVESAIDAAVAISYHNAIQLTRSEINILEISQIIDTTITRFILSKIETINKSVSEVIKNRRSGELEDIKELRRLKKLKIVDLSIQQIHDLHVGDIISIVVHKIIDLVKVRILRNANPAFSVQKIKNLVTNRYTSYLISIFKPERPLSLHFSTDEGWYQPMQWTTPDFRNITSEADEDVTLSVAVELTPNEPAITFPNPEALQEEFPAKMPMAKIEINSDLSIVRKSRAFNPSCTSQRCCPEEDNFDISLYHYLRHFQVENAGICVEVCGIRDLIVQNDESLQDVNSLIYPFGARPKIVSTGANTFLGPSFYVGSKEAFYKRWDSVRVNIEWNDRPFDFGNHYEAYGESGPFEDGSNALTNDSFKFQPSVLSNGDWYKANSRSLFVPRDPFNDCEPVDPIYNHNGYRFSFADFGFSPVSESIPEAPLQPLSSGTRRGFARFELQNVSFQHDRYAFVLAQQMFKLAQVADLIKLGETVESINRGCTLATETKDKIAELRTLLDTAGVGGSISDEMLAKFTDETSPVFIPWLPAQIERGLTWLADEVQARICQLLLEIQQITGGGTPKLPKEPYTPQIKTLSLDYTATADIHDVRLIHLYPFKNTHRAEDITAKPSLFPRHVDEGSLYLGLEQVKPGHNLNILFQLAESTANAEAERANIQWHYLQNNDWEPLHHGFHILEDGTKGLTRSGIIQIKSPLDFSASSHTIMPAGKYWLKASAFRHTEAVCETIQVHTQAALAQYQPQALNDRAQMRVEAEGINKLLHTNSKIKSVSQPYPSFEGRLAEKDQFLHRRISEQLRHKTRGITFFDYERLILDRYPAIWRAKSIAHTLATDAGAYFRDLEMAPGFVLIAVIPDIQRLTVSDATEPRCPVSLLDEVHDFLKKRISPFIRLKIENPRYERVHIRLQVKMHTGQETPFFQNKLETDIRDYLAPWRLGNIAEMKFGRPLYKTQLVQFIESRDYVDYISCLEWQHADDKSERCESEPLDCKTEAIYPRTARSILIGGKIVVLDPLVRKYVESDSIDPSCPKRKAVSCHQDARRQPVDPTIPVL